MIYTPDILREKLASEGVRGIALDIDETLSGTIYYWIAQYQKKYGNPEGLTATRLYQKYRYAENIPYWAEQEDFQEFTESMSRSNDVLEALELVENANQMVQKISSVVPVVAYITARPGEVIRGTRKWLEKHGFPLKPIMTRPDGLDHSQRHVWKAGVLHEMYPWVLGIVDDSAGLVDHLPDEYQGTVYLYDHTQEPETDIRAFACRNWEHAYEVIQANPPC